MALLRCGRSLFAVHRAFSASTAVEAFSYGNAGEHSAETGAASLDLGEVETILKKVHADDIRVIPMSGRSSVAEHMVIATGRSPWHVRNIAQALVDKMKRKRRSFEEPIGATIQGLKNGKWVVIDCGNFIVHALEENARAYYNLEGCWMKESSEKTEVDLEKSLAKIRRGSKAEKAMKSI